MSKIGWIGVGIMGSRMAKRLIDAGHEVYVCDVAADRVEYMVAQGAKAAKNACELMEYVDITFSIIPNDEILLDIVNGENGLVAGMKKNQVLIDMSTVSPAASAKVNTLLESVGGKFLRATVTGSSAYAESGTLGIMVSGERALYEECLPFLKVLGNRQTYLGEREECRYMKLIINMLMGIELQGFAECVAFGEKVGLNWETMLDLIGDSAAAPPVVRYKIDVLKKRDFSPMSFAQTERKDLALALDIARAENICVPTAAIAHEYYNAMCAQGMGRLDLSALIITNEKMNGIDHSD